MAEDDFAVWQGRKVVDPQGDKIGKVDDLFVDEESRQPEWLLIDTGMFGRSVFVPVADASFPDDDTVQVPFSRDQVKDAPDVAAGDTISTDDELRLYDYFGVTGSGRQSDAGLPDQGERPPESELGLPSAREQDGPPSSGGTTPSAQNAGVAEHGLPQEAEAAAGESANAGAPGRERVRVKKRIVTEPRTVYVEREEIVVERHPVGDETSGETSDAEGEVREEVLYEDEIGPEREVDRGEEHAA